MVFLRPLLGSAADLAMTVRLLPLYPQNVEGTHEPSFIRSVAQSAMSFHSTATVLMGKRKWTPMDGESGQPAKRRRVDFDQGTFSVGEGPKDPDKGIYCNADFRQDPKNWKRMHDRIVYLSQCRILAFYSLSLVAWKANCAIEKEDTVDQYGKATCGSCHAAHFSILSNLNFIPKKSWIYQVMNQTVEVHASVNKTDCLMERCMRPVALVCLNALAAKDRGKDKAPPTLKPFREKDNLPPPEKVTHPYNALQCFADWMVSFYNRAEESIQKKIVFLNELHAAETAFHDLEEKYINGQVSFKAYIGEIEKVKIKRDEVEAFTLYAPELTVKKRMVERLAVLEEIDKACQGKSKKQSVIDYLENSGKCAALEAFVKQEIKAKPTWEVKDLKDERYPLDMTLPIIKVQREATIVPKFSMLSGKWENGQRVAYGESELLEQKRVMLQEVIVDPAD